MDCSNQRGGGGRRPSLARPSACLSGRPPQSTRPPTASAAIGSSRLRLSQIASVSCDWIATLKREAADFSTLRTVRGGGQPRRRRRQRSQRDRGSEAATRSTSVELSSSLLIVVIVVIRSRRIRWREGQIGRDSEFLE